MPSLFCCAHSGAPRSPSLPFSSLSRAGATADVNITADEKSRVTVRTSRGAASSGGPGWPKDADEWRRLAWAALPWVAGAAIVAAAVLGVKKATCEEDKDDMSYGELTARKARKARGKGEEALEETKEATKRNWFGLKVRGKLCRGREGPPRFYSQGEMKLFFTLRSSLPAAPCERHRRRGERQGRRRQDRRRVQGTLFSPKKN